MDDTIRMDFGVSGCHRLDCSDRDISQNCPYVTDSTETWLASRFVFDLVSRSLKCLFPDNELVF